MREAGKTYREIAKELDVPIGSVRGWCHRAGLRIMSPVERLTAENERLQARIEELERQMTATRVEHDPADLYAMEVISIDEARAKGLRHYYTGKPCKRGHIAARTVCNRACVACASRS